MYISDHAVLRYLERHYGLDVEKIRAEMQTPILEIADDFGCSTVVAKGGGRLVIRDGIVQTFLPKRRGR